ncbi:MAG TPA: histidine kinase dimerization/phospho-acceptor domain-containing protein, partial [Candidatus Limnocylindria bacterium]|nr:histidine kinase dimerization/phospho-acceptor domain-containing protein [Candidatus Limnocylindria bacterium]
MPADDLGSAVFEVLLRRSGETMLLLVDDRLRVVRAGAEAVLLAERSADELVGMSLIAAFGSAGLDTLARQASAQGEPVIGEAELGRLGSRSFAVEALPLTGGGLVISLHEITTQRRIERVRRDFVANISHELRTPLASIKLLAETLSGGAVEDPQTSRDFSLQIEREVDHLAQLVDELLDLSMIESGETQLAVEEVDPAGVVASIVERIRPVAERAGVRIRQEPMPATDDVVRAAADPARLGQALLNLAHNAVKFSHPGGEVRVGWLPQPVSVRFLVADDGIGVPAPHQSRIFERFYKVDRSRARERGGQGETGDASTGGSAGLGLAIVRH